MQAAGKRFRREIQYVVFLIAIGILMIPAFAYADDAAAVAEENAAAAADADSGVLEDLQLEEKRSGAEPSRFVTRRLIVLSAQLEDSFGAINAWETGEEETVFEYATEDEAEAAYEQLRKTCTCYPDEVLRIETDGTPIEDLSLGMAQLRTAVQGSDVTVAVLDTGIDPARFENAGVSSGRISGASFDFINNTDTCSDAEGHGTTVAGIVAKNTPGNVSILSCKVLDQANNNSSAQMSTLLLIGSAVRYAQANGADVINMSFDLEPASGGSGSLDYLNDIIEDAYQDDVICTVASGNDGKQITGNDYPACLGSVVTVGSVDGNGERSEFSNYGKTLDFVAPGELPEMKGTSAAAPCIAACFAYLKGSDPKQAAPDLIERLRMLCTDLGDPDKDDQYGWGLPDMSKAGLTADHHYTKTILQPATCTAAGVARYECSDAGCDAFYEKAIPATGHTWEAAPGESTLRFTCSNRGCGAVLEGDALSGEIGGFQWELVHGGNNSSGMPVAHLQISGSGVMPQQDEYPWQAFRDHITTIVFSDDITALPANAFRGMKSLEYIAHTEDMADGTRKSGFPAAMTRIGEKAFFNCDALKTVTLGAGVSSIGDGAFSGCDQLENISVQQSNTSFMAEDGCLYNRSASRLLLCANTDGSFRQTVTSIAPYALYGSAATTVTIPSGVTQIGAAAFAKCHALRSVLFCGTGDIAIGENAFRDVNAGAYYPEGATGSWISGSYGGILRWHASNLTEDNAEVTLSQDTFEFTGEPIYPEVTVTIGTEGIQLEQGKDYDLVYSGNVNPGTAQVQVIGTNEGYSGVLSKTFTIEKAPFDFRNLSVPETVCAGEEVPVTYNGTLLKEIQELEIHYEWSPAERFHEEDTQDSKVLIADKKGEATLTVIADSNEFYEADVVKRYQVQVLPCAGGKHIWNKGVVQKPATYTQTGVKRFTCTRCGEIKDVTIAKIPGAKPGSVRKVGKLTYKVRNTTTVTLTKAPNLTSITVPNTVTINHKTYKVYSIGSKAFYKKTKLKKLVIGKNVTVIGAKACYGCGKLRYITIKGTGLKSVGKGAFSKIHKKAVAKVPKKKVKKYRGMLKKAGMNGKKQVVKAL